MRMRVRVKREEEAVGMRMRVKRDILRRVDTIPGFNYCLPHRSTGD
jgi:hypothetical protein